jgi:Arc/MetJ-type ribon-helix-helix transcriptional regulator
VSRKLPEEEKKTSRMRNITINIPECYDKNIQKLINLKIVPSRSEAIRTALREFIENEDKNLELLEFYKKLNK